jgi:tRNA dimethylallyltransferase
MKTLPPAIFLLGPTASGKTGVAVELVQRLPVELISVDSALVFRDMDIGTAKPDAATLARAPHHLIDIIDPTEAYSAAAFRRDALRLMADITARGKIPLLVGGTMLYFKALREGLSPLPQADPEMRAELDAELRSTASAFAPAARPVDAETAARLAPNDTQRVQRAMEIFRLTGSPMSVLLRQQTRREVAYRILPIALIPSDRAQLRPHRDALQADAGARHWWKNCARLRSKYRCTPTCPQCAVSATGRPGASSKARSRRRNCAKQASPPRASSPSASSPGCAACPASSRPRGSPRR